MLNTKTLKSKSMTAHTAAIISQTDFGRTTALIPIPYSIASLATKPFTIPGTLQMFPAMPSLTVGCWDPYVSAIDPAIYYSEAWLSAAVFAHNCCMEFCEDLCSVKPELGVGFQLSSQLFTHGVEQTAKLFGMWIPKAPCKPAPIIREMFELEEEALKEAIEVETEALERSMDIATGATAAWERRSAAREASRHQAKRLPRGAHKASRSLHEAV